MLGPLLFLPSAMVYFLIIFVICSLLQARYIRIIQEILAFFICLIVELIFENSQFGLVSKVLSFSTRQVVKFKTVDLSVCVAKNLKNSFFPSQISSLLRYIPFLFSFSFFFTFKKIIPFYSVTFTHMVFSIVPGSLCCMNPPMASI